MDDDLHRHDITDRAWEIIAPPLPGKPGDWGGVAKDNRLFINAVLGSLRTGAPWRDWPREYGDGKNTHRLFCRWRDQGVGERLWAAVLDDPDFEGLRIDATHAQAHRHAWGAPGGHEAIGRTQGGSTPRFMGPWRRRAGRCESLSQRVPSRMASLLPTA